MRAKEFIKEIEPIRAQDYTLRGGNNLPYITSRDISYGDDKTKEVLRKARPFIPNFNISIIQSPEDSYEKLAYISTNNKEIVGFIQFYDLIQYLQIRNVKVLPKARGNNLGVEGYKYLMKKYKKPVASDYMQTTASQKLWVRLASSPGVTVTGLLIIAKKLIPRYRNELAKMQAQPLNQWDTPSYTYFTFPTTKASKVMKAASASKIKLYDPNGPEDVDIGLVAYMK
jgi:hypothetical protein